MRRRDLRENGVDLGQPLGAECFACLFAEIKAFGGDAIGKDDLVIVEQKVMIAERRNIIGQRYTRDLQKILGRVLICVEN